MFVFYFFLASYLPLLWDETLAPYQLFDIIFGTFRNPKDFVSESGFAGASSRQIPEMLLWRDIAANEYDQSVRLSPK